MTKKLPHVCVVVPTLNRPELASTVATSVLNQLGEFTLDLVISNNGACNRTRAIFASSPFAGRIKYRESAKILPMPTHWELITSDLDCDYFMILPDRRILKQGALEKMVAALEKNEDCEAAVCGCDEWSAMTGRLIESLAGGQPGMQEASEIKRDFESGFVDRNSLPLGLNCLMRNDFVSSYRRHKGVYFDAISPDYRSAFNFVYSGASVWRMGEALMISTGFELSNGGGAYRGDGSYLESLGDSGNFQYMPPHFEGNVWAAIYEDYLRAKFSSEPKRTFHSAMTRSAMLSIMAEEYYKLAISRSGKMSWRHCRAVRASLIACGWSIFDDAKASNIAISSLRHHLPLRIKKIFYLYKNRGIKTDANVLQLAGFVNSN